jgi:heme exporter protein D
MACCIGRTLFDQTVGKLWSPETLAAKNQRSKLVYYKSCTEEARVKTALQVMWEEISPTYNPLVLLIVECNMGLHMEQRTMNKKHRQRQRQQQQQQQLLAWEMRVFVSELRARL